MNLITAPQYLMLEAETLPPEGLLIKAEWELVHDSPFQYRTTINEAKLAELTANIIETGGIHQPILVRRRLPNPPFTQWMPADGFEIVAGHRRKLAGIAAGMTGAPLLVRDLTDTQARKIQITENVQREDVHAIEEAEGFQALIDNCNETPDTIAQQLGKSRSHVYGRLKLLQACPPIRRACLAGEIGAEVALLIARLRTDKLQEKALGYIKGKGYDLKDGGTRSCRSVKELLNERFTLQLKTAMFDIEDEMLVPLAGHCIRCPKRSGNAPEYEDILTGKNEPWRHHNFGADVCTDPDCFDAKKKAHLKREAGKLEAKGTVVIDGNKARAAIDARGELKGAYIALKDVQAELKKAPKKGLAGTDLPAPAVVVIQDPRTGKTTKAVLRDDLKAAGVKVKAAPAANDHALRAQADRKAMAKREADAEAATAINMAILDRTLAAMANTQRTTQELYWMAESVFDGTGFHTRTSLAKRHGFETPNQLEKVLGQWPADRLALFAVECVLIGQATISAYASQEDRDAPLLMASAKHYGVDVDAVRAELTDKPASTPPPAAQAKKNAKAAQAKTKGKGKGEEQTDDAGVAGGSAGQVDAFDEVDA